VALVSALLTALSYASLGSRYLRAAGAAYVAERAYGLPLLSLTVGLALVYSGLTSVATQSHVFATNLAVLLHIERIPLWWLVLGFLLVLAGVVFRGIRESMWLNVLCLWSRPLAGGAARPVRHHCRTCRGDCASAAVGLRRG
jgi:amino acid transporter